MKCRIEVALENNSIEKRLREQQQQKIVIYFLGLEIWT